MLQELQFVEGAETAIPPDPPRTCEACGTVVADGSQAMNIIIQVGVAGHPAINPFQCPCIQHWACSPGCWKAVAHACIDEHMHEVLKYHHQKVGLT